MNQRARDQYSPADSSGTGTQKFTDNFATALPHYGRPWQAEDFPQLSWHIFNDDLAHKLDLAQEDIELHGTGFAMAYSGHQFGQFNPTMGDGRALLLGEVKAPGTNQLIDVHLKGSGRTPYSRQGDGQATLGPMLREYLFSEAMHALSVPTTRSLGVLTTGKRVIRNKLETGAMLVRTASSHIRVGTFQYGAIKDQGTPRDLLDYAIERHYPGSTPQEFFTKVVEKQARLVAKWMRLGFIHGVMNTDNTTISGETIDYGPCAFMDHFDPKTVFSSIDTQGRYAYANQPVIIGWNLARFAEAIIDAIGLEHAQETMNRFPVIYRHAWLDEMAHALGVSDHRNNPIFSELADSLTDILTEEKLDLTTAMRFLSEDPRSENNGYQAHVATTSMLRGWAEQWQSLNPVHQEMQTINPIYIPRNHLVDQAIKAAEEGSLERFNELLQRVTNPFTPQHEQQGITNPVTPEDDQYRWPAPEEFTESFRTFCGT